MLEYEEAGMPPVLAFDYEVLLDARRFDKPVNYALLRITTVGDQRAEQCIEAVQRIVYLIDPRVGHLGIFVSASVVRFEHRAILESLADIEALAPGLYEMKIANPTGNPDCHKPYFSVTFEQRRVEDLAFGNPREAFERVRAVSHRNESLYETLISPWVQMAANPWSASTLKWLNPMRTSRYLLSEKFSPWMHLIAALAQQVHKNRVSVPDDSPFRAAEKAISENVSSSIATLRRFRDRVEEENFRQLYG
jgi:Protein of unknown function (DUF3141)